MHCMRSNIGSTPSINRMSVLEGSVVPHMHRILLGLVRIEQRGVEAQYAVLIDSSFIVRCISWNCWCLQGESEILSQLAFGTM